MTILPQDGAGNRFIGKAEKKVGYTWTHSDTLMPQFHEQFSAQLIANGSGITTTVTAGNGVTVFGGTSIIYHPPGFPNTSGWWAFWNIWPFRTADRMDVQGAIGTTGTAGTADTISGSASAAQSTSFITYFGTIANTGGYSFGIHRSQESGGIYTSCFIYGGRLISRNPSSRYSLHRDSSIYIGVGNSSFTTNNTSLCTIAYWRGGSVQGKTQVYKAGDALYSITCANGETPGAMWATDWIVFEPDPAEDYPYIGRVENLLLGYGAYTQGNVYYINPSSIGAAMNGGSNYYIPVGRFGDRTILMRIGNPT